MSGSNGHYTDPFFNTSDDYSTPYSHSGQSSPYEPMFPQHIDVSFCSYPSIYRADLLPSQRLLCLHPSQAPDSTSSCLPHTTL
jgi:hypothetical protein